MEPLITVLMPVYNEKERYLKKSIESILQQTFSNFEFIIINDGSDNKRCIDILQEYANRDARIKLINYKRSRNTFGNTGVTAVLNFGLEEARGKYVARIDSDDFADKERFSTQLDFMENNPDFALCGTWGKVVNKDDAIIGEKKGYSEYDEIKKKIISINHFTHSTLFFNKDTVLSIGGYNNQMIKAQDYDLLLKIIPRYKVRIIPEFLSYYRANDDSISFSNNKLQEKYAMRARLNALRFYGYPNIYYLKLIRPMIFYLFIPSFVKKILMKMLWKI